MVNNANFTLLLSSSGQDWQFHIATDIATEISSWGLIFARCNMQYCCSSTFWQVKFADAVFTSIRYTPTQICQKNRTRWDVRWSTPDKQSGIPLQLVRWSDQDQMWDEVPSMAFRYTPPVLTLSSLDWQFHIATESSGQECQFHIATNI